MHAAAHSTASHGARTVQSTYKVRRQECDELAAKAGAEFNFRQLADIKDEALLQQVCAASDASHDISLPVMGCIILTI